VAVTYNGAARVGAVIRHLSVMSAAADDPGARHGPLRLALCHFYARRRARGNVQTVDTGRLEGGAGQRALDVNSSDACWSAAPTWAPALTAATSSASCRPTTAAGCKAADGCSAAAPAAHLRGSGGSGGKHCFRRRRWAVLSSHQRHWWQRSPSVAAGVAEADSGATGGGGAAGCLARLDACSFWRTAAVSAAPELVHKRQRRIGIVTEPLQNLLAGRVQQDWLWFRFGTVSNKISRDGLETICNLCLSSLSGNRLLSGTSHSVSTPHLKTGVRRHLFASEMKSYTRNVSRGMHSRRSSRCWDDTAATHLGRQIVFPPSPLHRPPEIAETTRRCF